FPLEIVQAVGLYIYIFILIAILFQPIPRGTPRPSTTPNASKRIMNHPPPTPSLINPLPHPPPPESTTSVATQPTQYRDFQTSISQNATLTFRVSQKNSFFDHKTNTPLDCHS